MLTVIAWDVPFAAAITLSSRRITVTVFTEAFTAQSAPCAIAPSPASCVSDNTRIYHVLHYMVSVFTR